MKHTFAMYVKNSFLNKAFIQIKRNANISKKNWTEWANHKVHINAQ